MGETELTLSQELVETGRGLLPLALTAIALAIVLWRTDRWFAKRPRRLNRPFTMIGLTLLGLLALLLAAPVETETRGQLIGLLGLALTAVIALASTAFVSNAMAGLMLRSLDNFRVGDFIRMEDHIGRVTERGLFHTEIQTEDRDLTTIPNLLLATRPTSVVRASGTIISARVSLGYDVPRGTIEKALLAGAEEAGLEEPFVQVLELGDFSVTYRVAGFLTEVKQLVSAKSRLRASAMDALHGEGIEIVSPTFMNQRRVDGVVVAPEEAAERAPENGNGEPERVMFDKADAAERVAEAESELKAMHERAAELEEQAKSAEGQAKESAGAERERVLAEAEAMEARVDEMRKENGKSR